MSPCKAIDRERSGVLLSPASAKACEVPHTDDDLCHYVVVRTDIPSWPAQIVHAAGESAYARVPKNTVAVALAADSVVHLLEIRERIGALGIPHVLITECDGEPMAIGIEPTRDRPRVRKAVGNLRCLR